MHLHARRASRPRCGWRRPHLSKCEQASSSTGKLHSTADPQFKAKQPVYTNAPNSPVKVSKAIGEVTHSGPIPELARECIALMPTHEARQAVINMTETVMAPYLDLLFGPRADLLSALCLGLITPQEATLDDQKALKAQVTARMLLHHVAQGLLILGLHKEACEAYGSCAAAFMDGGRAAQQRREHAVHVRPMNASNRERGKHEREVYKFWSEAAEKASSPSGKRGTALGLANARRIHELGVQRGVWPSALQRPVGQWARRLTARPFWEARQFPIVRALEAGFHEIAEELSQLLDRAGQEEARARASTPNRLKVTGPNGDAGSRGSQPLFAQYRSDALLAGEWTDFQLYAGCLRDMANCALCPRTAEIIASCAEVNTLVCGAHFFSRLTPGTHIGSHCGPSNLRLRCHLGLVVPDGCRIRVGEETRNWRVGECLVFDDSFEHEVFHEGSADRIVLICDLWHPELSMEADIWPTLSTDERYALDAARRGAHLPVKQRHYTVGGSVTRQA